MAELIARGELDAELAALIVILAGHGLPLTVASSDTGAAREFRDAVSSHLLAASSSRASLAGGVVLGNALEDVLRILGGAVDTMTGDMADESRDVGVVVVIGDIGQNHRVRLAHYVRPVERDGAGHLQRRPPAVLCAWNEATGRFDHFYWAITDELAMRVSMDRHDFENAHDTLVRHLSGVDSRLGPTDARH
ncbi:MAG: hypothetical protein ABIP53_06575 [Candidatus Limnocylindrales bacterium]